MEIDILPEGSNLVVTAENVLIGLQRPSNRRLLPADHNLDPDFQVFDKGFDQVANIQNIDINWGVPSPKVPNLVKSPAGASRIPDDPFDRF